MKMGYRNTYRGWGRDMGKRRETKKDAEVCRGWDCDGIATVCWESGVIVDWEPIKQQKESKP